MAQANLKFEIYFSITLAESADSIWSTNYWQINDIALKLAVRPKGADH
jgi:hypothetical protein